MLYSSFVGSRPKTLRMLGGETVLRAALRPRRSIRTRILAIAWIPSFVLLGVGVVAAGVLASEGAQNKQFATSTGAAIAAVTPFILADQRERELTAQYLADPRGSRTELDAQRVKTDASLAKVTAASADIQADAPENFKPIIENLGNGIASIPDLRKKVDSRSLTPHDAVEGYSDALGAFQLTFIYLADNAASAKIAEQILLAADLFRVAEWRSHNEAIQMEAHTPTGLAEHEFSELVDLTGGYRSLLATTIPRLPAQQQAALASLMSSTAWQQLSLVEKTTLETSAEARGSSNVHRAGSLPVSRSSWQAASAEVSSKLLAVYATQALYSNKLSVDQAQQELSRSLLSGFGMLLLGLAVFAIVTRLSTALVGRLRRLQNETLELANVQLPAIVDRLRGGEKVDVEQELPALDHGVDEIGRVAAAFNQAQQAAVAAAVMEAETRAGTEKVFLNIAHRNQLIAHNQLKVLDQAERSQEDPDQLDLLFQLDHLATRARRNAENLIILGGGRAGRRWRNPVPLQQVVRSAIGEAEAYTRVGTGQIPPVSVTGAAVADLAHLLAELVDNATSFSPPSARVEVRGNVVGRGIVIEIEDQGLGIEPDQLQELNAMLQSTPDFGLMALSEEPRLGLFVVTQLANRHGVRVTLTDSPSYGGIRAVVLVPTALLAGTGAEQPGLELDRAPDRQQPLDIMQGSGEDDQGQQRSHRANQVIKLAPAEPDAPNEMVIPRELLVTAEPLLRLGSPRRTEPGPIEPAPIEPVRTASATAETSAPQYVQDASPTILRRSRPEQDAGSPVERATQTAEIPQIRRDNANGPTVPQFAPDPARGPVSSNDERPALPRRTRQAHLAPQLQTDEPTFEESPPSPPAPELPSADHARDRLAAFQRGTRLGRES
jgi:signal transduction histidine kinase